MSDMIMTDIPKQLSGWPEHLAWWANYPFNLYDRRAKRPSEISGQYQCNHSYMPCMHTCTCTFKMSKKKERKNTIHEVWISVYLLIVMHLGRGADHHENLLCKWVLFVTSIWKLICSLFLWNLNGFCDMDVWKMPHLWGMFVEEAVVYVKWLWWLYLVHEMCPKEFCLVFRFSLCEFVQW